MLRIPVTLVLLLLGTAFASAQNFQAGSAIVDTTPTQWPQNLIGGFTPKPCETAHDPLNTRAFAFQNGDGRVVIATVDACVASREVLDECKALAAEATGWKTSEMMISSTHTHSAPSPRAETYRETFVQGTSRALIEAIRNLRPAKLGYGEDAVPEEVFNRRWYLEEGKMPLNPFGKMDQVKMNPNRSHIVKPAGPTDPTVAVLDIRDNRNQPIGIYTNYPLHYIGATNSTVSADYFGEYGRILLGRNRNAKGFVAALSNGASGDINNIDFDGTRPPRAPFEQIQVVARKVADATWRATQDIELDENPKVAILQREVSLRKRTATPAEIERAMRIIKMSDAEIKEADLPRLATNYASRTMNHKEPDQTYEILIQAIQLGDTAMVTLPFEVLVEIGLEIKEKSPFPNTIFVGLANGAFGYLPTPEQHELGGYETWLGTCRVESDSSVVLTKHLLEMLAELHGE
ncbi:MAG: neutral/alkaline non-lysosomal ceramidase N-terminal domain-containing protein [Verrucomicrobiales bacterium]